MGVFPILEIVALVDKNCNGLTVNCLVHQPSKFVCCNKWPGSGVPARGSYLSQAAVEHANVNTDSGIGPKQESGNRASSSSTRELNKGRCAQM